MADNLSKTEWDAGTEVASDDIAGLHHPRIKIQYGVDGSATDVSATDPLPTTLGGEIVTVSPNDDDTASGSLASGASQAYLLSSGRSSISWQITGTWTGNLFFEKSLDNSTWEPMSYVSDESIGGDLVTETTVNGIYFSSVGSTQRVRIRRDAGTGTIDFTVARSIGIKSVALNHSLPSGANTIGAVNLAQYSPVSGRLPVDGSGVTQPVSGTFWQATQPVSGTFWQATQPVSGTVTASNTSGDVAHDGVDSGNPISIGGIARTALTSVAALDRVKGIFDLQGRQIIRSNVPRGLRIKNTITLTSTTETTLLAQAASTFHDLTKLWVANTSATAVRVDFRDTTGGSVLFALYAPAGQTVGFTDSNDPIEQATVNTNWTAQLSAGVTDVRIFAQAVKNIA